MVPKVYVIPNNELEIITKEEADELKIKIEGFIPASINHLRELVSLKGDDWAYIGAIETIEGVFEFDFDLGIYRELVLEGVNNE